MAQITQEDLQAALPDVTCPMQFEALMDSVDVYRDLWGIPHIRAERETDLFFAQGFVTAQDRLWHMDFDRHQALGRWAEFAGVAGVEGRHPQDPGRGVWVRLLAAARRADPGP